MIVEFSVVGWAIVRVMGCAIINPEILGTRDSLISIFELQACPAIHFVCFANGHLLCITHSCSAVMGWTRKSVVMVWLVHTPF